jgi:hypothetical protein
MLQELGYEKQLKYYGTQLTYEGSVAVWHVKVYIFTPKPLRGVCEVKKIYVAIAPRHTFYAGIRDATSQAYMVTHSHHCQLLDGMEYVHFSHQASGSTYIHVEPVPDSRNFKLKKHVDITTTLTTYIHVELVPDSSDFRLKKQVDITTTLTNDLDSSVEEVEFWQEKYEDTMKIVLKLKHHCPQGLETLSKEETEESTLASPPHKMATCAPSVYVIPHNDDD